MHYEKIKSFEEDTALFRSEKKQVFQVGFHLTECPVLQCWVCSFWPYYLNDKTMIIKSAWQDFILPCKYFQVFSHFSPLILLSSLQTSFTFRKGRKKKKNNPKTYLKVSECNSFLSHFSFLLGIFQIIFWHMNKLLLVSSQHWKALEAT